MSRAGAVYGKALYELAREEHLTERILEELTVLNQSFHKSPDYIRLLCCHSLSGQERCRILDDGFRGRIHIYVLNFLKILTLKGYLRQFDLCCREFESCHHRDSGILNVTAVTAVALTPEQIRQLTGKLSRITGKQIRLHSRVEPECLGGIRLDYDGHRLDGTLISRLDAIRKKLKNTAL